MKGVEALLAILLFSSFVILFTSASSITDDRLSTLLKRSPSKAELLQKFASLRGKKNVQISGNLNSELDELEQERRGRNLQRRKTRILLRTLALLEKRAEQGTSKKQATTPTETKPPTLTTTTPAPTTTTSPAPTSATTTTSPAPTSATTTTTTVTPTSTNSTKIPKTKKPRTRKPKEGKKAKGVKTWLNSDRFKQLHTVPPKQAQVLNSLQNFLSPLFTNLHPKHPQ